MRARVDGSYGPERAGPQPVEHGHRPSPVLLRAVAELSVAVQTPAPCRAVGYARAAVEVARDDLRDSGLRAGAVQHLHRQKVARRRAVPEIAVVVDAPAARGAVGD